MEQEGKCPEWLKGFDWAKLDVSFAKQDFFDNLSDAIAKFLSDKAKKTLFDWAMKNELFLAPVNDVSDLLENPQLKSRDFWVRISHDELNDEITYPGAFAKLSETPITFRKRAPLPGEHNDEIYSQELHISTVEFAKLKKDKVI